MPLWGLPFAVALEQCLSVVLLSDSLLYVLLLSVCLFVFMSVGVGFDPPVKLTCRCTPVFRRPNVCIGLVDRTDRHCSTACVVALNTKTSKVSLVITLHDWFTSGT